MMKKGAIHVLESILGMIIILSVLSTMNLVYKEQDPNNYFNYKNLKVTHHTLLKKGSINISVPNYVKRISLLFNKEKIIYNKSALNINIQHYGNEINVSSDDRYCNISYDCVNRCDIFLIYKNKTINKFYAIEYLEDGFYGTY